MHRIDHAPVSQDVRRKMRTVASQIGRRTGLRCSYNAFDKTMFFHYTPEPDSGPLSLPVFDGNVSKTYSSTDIDDAVRYVNYGKMSRSQKDRIASQQKQMEQWEQQDKRNRFLAERRPDAEDFARFLDQKRRGVGKVIST